MNELVSLVDIQNYAVRNTAERMPIERKFLNAFISSLLNSTAVKTSYEVLKNSMWNEELPMMFLSYWDSTGTLNKEPYRSIIAYSMIKKDQKLIEMISNALFTGTTRIVYDENFAEDFVEFTDQNDSVAYYSDGVEPVKVPFPEFKETVTYNVGNFCSRYTYVQVTPTGNENPSEEGWYEYNSSTGEYVFSTDTTVVSGKTYYDGTNIGYVCKHQHTGPWNDNDFGQVPQPDYYIDWQINSPMHFSDAEIYTDMVGGIPYLVFQNIYCDDPVVDPIYNSRFQTRDEMELNLNDFYNLISICKPARAEVLLVFQPFCFLTGDNYSVYKSGIADSSEITPFESPFGNQEYYDTIMNLTDNQLIEYYSSVSAIDLTPTTYDPPQPPLVKTQDELYVTREIIRDTGYMLFRYELHTRNTDFIWGNVVIKGKPEDSHPEYPYLPDIKFSPKDVMIQTTTNHYFMIFDLKLPRND